MSLYGSAVHVVTTDGPGGKTGFTATAICSVSDNPPTLLVCLNRKSQGSPLLAAKPQLVVLNKAGGSGTVGAALAARANPDGHTLYVGYTSETVIVPPLVGRSAVA